MRLAPRRSLRLRLPRLKTFLGCVSLQTGAEVVAVTLLINKVTGFYGLLAAFTGYGLTALQVSLYLWSVAVVIATAYLIPHIRRRGPFQNLALAWLYMVDTVANTAYTAAFAATWYIANIYNYMQQDGGQQDERRAEDNNATGSSSSNNAASTVVSSAAAAATTVGAAAGAGAGPIELTAAEFAAGFVDVYSSMALTGIFWAARIYFGLVLLMYARVVLRHFIASYSGLGRAGGALQASSGGGGDDNDKEDGNDGLDEDDTANNVLPNPFAEGAVLGAGWRGRLGRAMVSVGKGFWFGRYREPDVEWALKSARPRFSKRRGRKDTRVVE